MLVRDPKHGPACPEAKKAIVWLLALQKPDGSIHNSMLANYNTAIILSGLVAANDPALKGAIDKAVAYLKANQWSEDTADAAGQKLDANSPFYGGWGYGGTRGAPDLSNTAVVLDALKEAGVPQDDPAFQRAASSCRDSRTSPRPTPPPGPATMAVSSKPRPQRRGQLLCRRIHHPRGQAAPPLLWLDDLRGPEEHDPRGPHEG